MSEAAPRSLIGAATFAFCGSAASLTTSMPPELDGRGKLRGGFGFGPACLSEPCPFVEALLLPDKASEEEVLDLSMASASAKERRTGGGEEADLEKWRMGRRAL